MKLISIRSLWRSSPRSYSRLCHLGLTESEAKHVDIQTKHILDNANLDKPSDEIVHNYFNTSLKQIHPDFSKRNSTCPIQLEGMLKALELNDLVPQDMPLFARQHQIGMVTSLCFISEVEGVPKESLIHNFSEDQSISTITLRKWREKTLEILDTCGFKEEQDVLKAQNFNTESMLRSDLFELLCPNLKKEARGKFHPVHPVDGVRILALQRELNTPEYFNMACFGSSLDWLVQLNVCRELLGDERVAVFHLHELVALPIKFHFLRHLGLSEKLCKEALCSPLKIWPVNIRSKNRARNPPKHLNKLRKMFEEPCHELSLMCHISPAFSKIPKAVLKNAYEELNQKELSHCSFATKVEILKYILYKQASFDKDKLGQLNQERKQEECLFSYMVPSETFEDFGGHNVTLEDSKYFVAAGLSDNVRIRQSARNLCTFQSSRAFSTSSCSTRRIMGFEEPNFTRWLRVSMDTFFFRNSLDYHFDRKEFLKGCEMVSWTECKNCWYFNQYLHLGPFYNHQMCQRSSLCRTGRPF